MTVCDPHVEYAFGLERLHAGQETHGKVTPGAPG